MTAERNYRLLQKIEADRKFILTAYLQNPKLLEQADEQIKRLFDVPVCSDNPDGGAKPALQAANPDIST